jgi:TPR repeat protein
VPGSGLLVFPDGRQQAIHPDDMTFSGKASFLWPDGTRQAGHWLNGRLHGSGVEESSAGFYTGSWQHGQRSGEGEFRAVDGTVYTGQWLEDVRDGFGHQTYADDARYSGSWQNDQPQGFGQRLYANGNAYDGAWDQGQRHGYGHLETPAQVSYEGTWTAGARHGYGRQDHPDGSYYEGEWADDKRNGRGRERQADGTLHEGAWVNGKTVGPGTRTHRTGISLTGTWQGDVIHAGSLALPSEARYTGPLFLAQGRAVAPELLSWLSTGARNGDADAQYYLASVYLDFESPAPDAHMAQVWLQRSADLGHAEAQYRLAVLLEPTDPEASLELLLAAAAQQHPLAHGSIGEFYHIGLRLPKDLSAAVNHYQQAMELGSLVATNNLAWLLATTQDERWADPQRAIELIQSLVLYLGYWQHLDTLAAAHARLGHTELASRMQKSALDAAYGSAADPGELALMESRLALYEQGNVYTE